MMTTMKGTLRIALAACALLLGADAVAADDAGTREIRVLNNHATAVEVYVEDASGHTHFLGEVSQADLKFLELDEEICTKGAFRLKIYPAAPAGSLSGQTRGIKSVDLELDDGQAVNVWLGSELAKSQIEVTR